MKHRYALWVKCPCVGHSDTRQIRSQRLRTRLDIFHGFFFLWVFFFFQLWANIHKAYCNLTQILKNHNLLSDTHWIQSQRLRTRLDIFHEFFFLKLWANINKAYRNPALILKNT